MKGNPKVIEELNKALREEPTAINQYFLHAEMCENWGYRKLSEFIKKQSIGEMRHAESLLERILFLDGVPTMEPLKLAIGSNVRDMIEADLKLEVGAVAQYNAAVQIATEQKDNGSRDLLVVLAERRGEPRRLAGSTGASDQRNGLRTLSIDADRGLQRRRSVRPEPLLLLKLSPRRVDCSPLRIFIRTLPLNLWLIELILRGVSVSATARPAFGQVKSARAVLSKAK
jgi:bacterioferritin